MVQGYRLGRACLACVVVSMSESQGSFKISEAPTIVYILLLDLELDADNLCGMHSGMRDQLIDEPKSYHLQLCAPALRDFHARSSKARPEAQSTHNVHKDVVLGLGLAAHIQLLHAQAEGACRRLADAGPDAVAPGICHPAHGSKQARSFEDFLSPPV